MHTQMVCIDTYVLLLINLVDNKNVFLLPSKLIKSIYKSIKQLFNSLMAFKLRSNFIRKGRSHLKF